MNRVPNAYRVLQVDPAADFVVIHAAYRALARLYHPDGHAPDVGRMADLNRAFGILRDPEQRRRHDDRLASRITPADRGAGDPGAAAPVPPAPAPMSSWTNRGAAPTDHSVLDFGRYMGWRITDLARHDPDYLLWLSRHSSGLRYRGAIAWAMAPARATEGRSGAA